MNSLILCSAIVFALTIAAHKANANDVAYILWLAGAMLFALGSAAIGAWRDAAIAVAGIALMATAMHRRTA